MKQENAEGIANQRSEADGTTLSGVFTLPYVFIWKALADQHMKEFHSCQLWEQARLIPFVNSCRSLL